MRQLNFALFTYSMRTRLRAGDEIKGFPASPILFFEKNTLPYLWTAVSGTVAQKHATNPKSNRAYWRHKLSGNKSRDRLVTRTLRLSGWHVLRIWHHELKRKNESRLLRRLERALR